MGIEQRPTISEWLVLQATIDQLTAENKELKQDLRDYVAGLCDLCGSKLKERLASPTLMTLEQFYEKYGDGSEFRKNPSS